ncbi:MAG TPA: hypothetical protein VE860_09990, partial [Chthoniobacterales bacterium]|nr:hypothetical protein [Chthoniobacterales bacterium]
QLPDRLTVHFPEIVLVLVLVVVLEDRAYGLFSVPGCRSPGANSLSGVPLACQDAQTRGRGRRRERVRLVDADQ